MTKTTRTSSYLRQVARHHEGNLPFLKPPHTLAQHWRTLSPYDRASEIALSAQPPSARTGTILLLQEPAPLSMQHATKPQPALPTTKTAQPVTEQEAPSLSSTPSSTLHAPVAPSDSFPVTEELAAAVRNQQSQVEIQPAAAKSTHTSSSPTILELAPTKSTLSAASETSRAPREKKPASITLHPPSRQQQEVTGMPTNGRQTADFALQEGSTSARAPEPQHRPAIGPHKQEAEQHATIHIGTIDIHIVPSTPPPAPLPPARSTTARSHSTPALSREMTSFIGLRQG